MTVEERIRSGEITVAIVGMGRVGLPLGVAFAKAGARVMGVDVDANRRSAIERGKLPFHEVGAEEPLAEVVEQGRLTVHADPSEVIPQADALILCVGTPLGADLRPDYDQLRSALSN